MRLLRVMPALVLLPVVAAAANVGVTAKKLIVVDKLAAVGKAKVVYVSKDRTAGITKGAGTDVDAIAVSFHVAYADGSASGSFVLPAGASDGTAGWVVNTTKVAKYVNRTAPLGPTEVKVVVIKPDKLLRLVARGLGDTPIDLLAAGAPTGGVATRFCVTNEAPPSTCFCSEFPTCTYKPIASNLGAKLVCRGGVPNPTCAGASPPCFSLTPQPVCDGDCAEGSECIPISFGGAGAGCACAPTPVCGDVGGGMCGGGCPPTFCFCLPLAPEVCGCSCI